LHFYNILVYEIHFTRFSEQLCRTGRTGFIFLLFVRAVTLNLFAIVTHN
jgi:hypothetical protein